MRKVLNIDEWYNSIEKASVEVHEAYGGNMSDFRYEYPVKFEEVTGNSEKAIKKISKAGKGYEVRTSIYMSKNELEAVGKEMGLELISYEKSSSVVVAVYESAVNEAKYPVSQWKWDAKHPYSFKIYLKNGDKHNTDFYDLESAKKMKQVLDKDKETYVIHKSNDGQFNDEVRDLMRESINEDVINELSGDTYKNTVKAALQRGDSRGNSLAMKALQSFGKEIAKELAGKSFEVKGSMNDVTKALYRGSSMSYINQVLMTFTGEGSLMYDDTKVFGSDEAHFNMNVEFQLPDNWGGWSAPVKFAGYKGHKIPGIVQFSIREGKVWVWFKAADTDLEFTRTGAREMAKLADTIVTAMDFPTNAKHNTIKQFDPMKPTNESVNEGYVPSNIKDFAKRKGITSLVNTVAGWVEKVGKRISGGTAIGKDYGTLILDIKYQDSAIRINVEDETVELYDEPVSNLKEFKQVYNEYQTEDMNEARSINKIQKDWGKITADMKDTVDMWKAAEGKDKEDLLAKLKDLTAQKKKLEAELNDAVGLKDADAELVGESFNPIESVVESYDELNERHITLKRKYTENYPAKTAGKTAIVRNKMLDAIADGRLTQEQFDALLSEFSADGKRWMKANAQYFNVSEDGVALSKFGKRALAQLPAKPQASVNETKQIENKPMRFIYESFESFINEARETYVCYWKEGTMKMHFYSEHTSMKSAEKMMEIMLKTNALHTKDGVGIMPKSEWDRLEVDGYAFNEGLVTEAFQSSKLASLLNLSGFNSRTMKALYNYTKVKLDQITDDQIVELHPMEAYKSKVKGIYFYILDNPKDNPYATSKYVRQLSGNTLLAVATGSNDFLGITYSRYWSKNGQDINMSSTNSASDTIGVDKRYSGYEASGLYNVKRIAEVADRVLMFNPDILPSTLDMRRERNAAKAGATAFMSDKDFKAENTKRYREILQTRAMNDDIDSMVENAVNELADQIKTATKKMEMGRYGDLLIGTSPKGQEVKLRDASNHMANILDSYSRYVEYVNKLKKEPESGSYYKKEAAVYAKDVKDRVSKISNLDYAW